MKYSNVLVKKKGEVKEKTQVKRKRNRFVVKFKDGNVMDVDDDITFTTTQLYFKEPKNINRIFSEKTGRFSEIRLISDGTYEMTNSEGTVNTYYYIDGQLERIKVDAGIVNFEIHRS